MRFLVLALAALAVASAARAQPVFDRLTRADGLPSDYVLAVLQDRWGFVWFGTDAGAVRWDGRRAQTFSVDHGLPHPYVKDLAEDGDGTLWAGTNGGIARWTGSAWETVQTPLGDTHTSEVTTGPSGRLVVSGNRGISRREGDRWRVWSSTSARHPLAPLYFPDDERIVVTGFNGERYGVLLTPDARNGFRADTLRIEGFQIEREGHFLALHQAQGRLYGHLPEGGRQFGTVRLEAEMGQLIADSVWSPAEASHLVFRGDGAYALGTGGLRPFDPATGEAGEFLLTGYVTTVGFDREGGLWAGTFGQGAVRLRSTHLSTVSERPSRRIALDGDAAWVAGYQHLVHLGLGARIPDVRLSDLNLVARNVAIAPDGRFRLVSGPSIFPLIPDGARFLQVGRGYIYADGRRVSGVLTDGGWISGTVETADSLWLGSYGNGIRRFLKTPTGFAEIDTLGTRDGLPADAVEDIVRTRAGIWGITRNGLALLQGDRIRAFGREEGLPSSAVFSVYEARDGTHWAGTDRGLARLDLARWSAEAVGDEAMAGHRLVAMFERASAPGVLWAVTTRALWRIQDGEAHPVSGFPLVRDDRQTIEDAVYHAPSDRLVLATSAGTVLADLAGIRPATTLAPSVALVGASVEDTAVDLLGTPRVARLDDLAPGQHRVEIEAAALQFGSEARVEWREPGGDWMPTLDGRLLLSDVGSGDHELEFRAVAPGGSVSEETARLAFTVRPHWWQRGSVQALLGLLGLAVLVGGVRYASQRRLRARVRELEVAERVRDERERISRDLHDHVGAEVAAILTRAEVARLRAGAEGRSTEEFRDVEHRARRTMGSLREAIWALGHGALTPAALAERLGQFAETQAAPLGLEVDARATGETDRALAPTQALALYRIGQEAVRNAVRHSGGTRLSIAVEASRQRVAVVVRDDGAFRETAGDGGGHGLGNMEARAEALGGSFSLVNGDGTTVRADVPLEP